MNEGFGKDFYRKGNSVKRSGPFSEPPDSENRKVADLRTPREIYGHVFFVYSPDSCTWLAHYMLVETTGFSSAKNVALCQQ